jgi:hypothetical protein
MARALMMLDNSKRGEYLVSRFSELTGSGISFSSAIDPPLLMKLSGPMLSLRRLEISRSSLWPLRKLPLRLRRVNACLRVLVRAGLLDFKEVGRVLVGLVWGCKSIG